MGWRMRLRAVTLTRILKNLLLNNFLEGLIELIPILQLTLNNLNNKKTPIPDRISLNIPILNNDQLQ